MGEGVNYFVAVKKNHLGLCRGGGRGKGRERW